MSSLADLPELVGFFSYSREDDADSQGALSALRSRIQGELRGQLGRTAKTFRLWQDKEAIPSGTLWESEITNSVEQAVFFVPIITPTVVASPYCRFELDAFLAREAALARTDLVFPILYIHVPALEDSIRLQNDAVLSLIAKRQYFDWREFRHLDSNSTEVKRAVERFCGHIRDALYKPWVSPEARKQQEEAAALERAEAERQHREAEAKWRAEEEAQQRATEEERQKCAAEAERNRIAAREAKAREEEIQRQRQVEVEQQRAAAERERADERRLREEAKAKRRAEAEEHGRVQSSQPRTLWPPSRPMLVGASLVGVVLLGVIGAWLMASRAPVASTSPAAVTPPSGSDSSAPPAFSDDLTETKWRVVGSYEPNNPKIYYFKADHSLTASYVNGKYNPLHETWKQTGNAVSIENSSWSEEIGMIQGDRMSGTGKNEVGETWTWTAEKE